MTRSEFLNKVNKEKVIDKAKIISWAKTISLNNDLTPKNLVVGDVFIHLTGTKKRPCIILKVGKDFVLAATLTTTTDGMDVIKLESRFTRESYIGANIGLYKKDYAKENYGYFFGDIDSELIIDSIKRRLSI